MKLKNYQAINRRPSYVLWILGFIWDFVFLNILRPTSFKALRFCRENSLNFEEAQTRLVDVSIDIVFVATKKDFVTLPIAALGAVKSLEGYLINQILVILPEDEIDLAHTLMKDFEPKLKIINENSLIPESQRDSIRLAFGSRYGWALQQFLKVQAVLQSSADGVLIVDADTILLKKRNWLLANKSQILLPSWDYQYSYYDFLAKFNFCGLNPPHYFVSHHMLMQPHYLKKALTFADFANLEDLISQVCSYEFADEGSPFCIEYELYGQFLWQNHAQSVRLAKWSNIGVPRSSLESGDLDWRKLSVKFQDYASVSLHSYL